MDLDSSSCAPELLARLGPLGPLLRVRVAVRALEAWLLADQSGIARYMKVARDRIPAVPENLPNPKQTMVGVAARSRDRSIRRDMVPRPGAGRDEGPA